MNLYGKAPSAPEGRYFRATTSAWCELWSFACEVSAVARSVAGDFGNDGDRLDAQSARKLAFDLRVAIGDGRAMEFERGRSSECAGQHAEWGILLGRPSNSDRARVQALFGGKPASTLSDSAREFAVFLDKSGGCEIR